MQVGWMARAVGAGAVAVAALGTAASPAAAQLFRDAKVKPDDAQTNAAWPADARARGVEGEANAICEARGARLENCQIVRESPKGEGFGEALLSLAPLFRPVAQPAVCDSVFNLMGISATWEFEPMDPPDWRRRPSPEQFWRAYPEGALQQQRFGGALLRCEIAANGELSGCEVLREGPEGFGFGAAALSLTPRFAIKPAKARDGARPSTVSIPVNFAPYPNVCHR